MLAEQSDSELISAGLGCHIHHSEGTITTIITLTLHMDGIIIKLRIKL